MHHHHEQHRSYLLLIYSTTPLEIFFELITLSHKMCKKRIYFVYTLDESYVTIDQVTEKSKNTTESCHEHLTKLAG